ncbi:MAG: transporter [Planctomycetes bacterium]|nr:transporter [Planctomycetota bacterium]
MALGALLASCALPDPEAPESELIFTDRPSFSDGTALIPARRVQLESGVTYTADDEDGVRTARWNAPEALLRYRLLENLEVRGTWSGYAWSDNGDGLGTERTSGATDPALGVKIPVCEQDGWMPKLSVLASTTLGLPENDFRSGAFDPTFKLLWSSGLPAGFGLGGNLNAAFPTQANERFSQLAGSLYATYAPSARWSVFAEGFFVAPPSDGASTAYSCDAGVLYLLSARVQLDARVGFGLNGVAEDFFAGVGVSWRF